MSKINKVGVIGAGTMGSGIASHVANAGVPVVLLDIVPARASSRNQVTEIALEKLRKSNPPAFMNPTNAGLITIGNTEDDLELLNDVDWIAEAIVERLEIKQALYERLESVRKSGSYVSSNTSTIPLSLLTEKMSDDLKRHFCITHFFNPVRYMRLLELVGGPDTDAQVLEELGHFCDVDLGKGVVPCNDTPGFLGNRVGVYALQVGITTAAKLGLSVEEADSLMGRPMGIPKTGVFGLYDLIGLDLMLDVVKSLATILPAEDRFHQVAGGLGLINQMVSEGRTGNKGGAGFYKQVTEGDSVVRHAVELDSGAYRQAVRPGLRAAEAGETEGLRPLVESNDQYSQFAWEVLSKTLSYAAELVPQTSSTITPIDEAMKLGYGWLRGPFEMIDELGVDYFADRLSASGISVPEIVRIARGRSFYRATGGRVEALGIDGEYAPVTRAPGAARLSDTTAVSEPLLTNTAASYWDLGDGVGCVEFHSKANALSPTSMALVEQAVDHASANMKALLIYNDAPHFSVGFNLDFALDAAKRAAWQELDSALYDFQQSCLALKYAPIPVVAAPAGMALGGGYEVLVHCDALQAHGNSVLGLVETLVGLVPSGGGCKELLYRWTSDATDAASAVSGAIRAFELIGMGKTGSSPIDSERHRFFLPRDRMSMNRDRLLPEAKALALELSDGYTPPQAPTFLGLGARGRDGMNEFLQGLKTRGITTPHDHTVGAALMEVLCGGDAAENETVSELDVCTLERQSFISLAKTARTVARIEHILSTGRPLRN